MFGLHGRMYSLHVCMYSDHSSTGLFNVSIVNHCIRKHLCTCDKVFEKLQIKGTRDGENEEKRKLIIFRQPSSVSMSPRTRRSSPQAFVTKQNSVYSIKTQNPPGQIPLGKIPPRQNSYINASALVRTTLY